MESPVDRSEPELFSWQRRRGQAESGALMASSTLDTMTSHVIRSGFDERLIGQYLLQLAEDDKGIELAIAFASIVAKAKRARFARLKK